MARSGDGLPAGEDQADSRWTAGGHSLRAVDSSSSAAAADSAERAPVRRWSDRLRPRPVVALCAVTLFIWGNRVWLAWTNPEDTLGQKLVWSAPITVFVVAAATASAMVLADRAGTRAFVATVSVLAAGTILYWGVRTPMILLADHPVGFKVVHALLAAVSVTASVASGRWVLTVGRLVGRGE